MAEVTWGRSKGWHLQVDRHQNHGILLPALVSICDWVAMNYVELAEVGMTEEIQAQAVDSGLSL